MSPKRLAQPRTASPEQSTGTLDRAHPPFDFTKPFLLSEEAAAYLGYGGKTALRNLYRFIKDKGVPTQRRFRRLLIARRDLDAAIGAGHRKGA